MQRTIPEPKNSEMMDALAEPYRDEFFEADTLEGVVNKMNNRLSDLQEQGEKLEHRTFAKRYKNEKAKQVEKRLKRAMKKYANKSRTPA